MDAADVELNLSEYLQALSRRRWIFASVWFICAASSVLYIDVTRPVFQGDTLVDIEKPGATAIGGTQGGIVDNWDEEYFRTQIHLLKNTTLLQKVYDDLRLVKTEDFEPPQGLRKLSEAVAIVPVPKTRLIYVQVRSHDPDLAIKVSGTLARYYVDQNLSSSLFMSRQVLQALQNKNRNGDPKRAFDALPSVVDNKLIQTLKEQKITLEGQIADMTMHYTPHHPQIIAARSRLSSLQKMLDQEVQNVMSSVKTELSGELLGNNVRVIGATTSPEKPVKPNKPITLLLGILGGLVFGIFAALFVDLLDQSVRTEEEVQQRLRRPFLGIVPRTRVKSKNKVYEALTLKEPSLTSEAFRNLRTMTDLASVNERSKALIITSTVQEEGKSFVSSNLSVAYAQLGERVLLIDGDLRRPKLHKTFGLPSDHGLSDYLAGTWPVEKMAEHVHKTDVHNLSVLPCGTRPPNPSELLNTPRLPALVSWAKEHYDRVFVDCTPVFPISDTLLWGRYIHAAVYVVRSGRTLAPIIRAACSRLDTGGINVLGVIVNVSELGGLSYAGGYHYDQYYYAQYTEREGLFKRAS
ncbi:MAG: polysaccharide biosynthesis tyrosine autokinase [Elusimicrobia bacterium]|nr:polysaccharide biosynthesis tyrosine autokinase [Elusimicrobiota bacterium]